jgi:signal transduction histidine kinase
MTNALKFTRAGTIAADVSTTDTVLTIAVTDTGAGIDASHQALVFEPFVSAIGAAGGERGSGLGLTLARELARRMGGDLVLERSEPGVGSRFRVDLPFSSAAAAAADRIDAARRYDQLVAQAKSAGEASQRIY